MVKDFNVVPGFYAAGLYVNCEVVEAGLKAAGGTTDDKEKFMAALKAVKLEGHAARADQASTISATWSATSTSAACEKAQSPYGLKLWNKTVKTYENVSQFWTWPEKEFLAHPVYSRDYPPLKKC